MSTVAFSSSGTLLNENNVDDVVNTQVRVKAKVTVVNSEVVTITHFTDTDLVRSVRVLVASTGLDAATGTSGVSSVSKASASGTAITFGSGAAGTYFVIIDN